MLNIHKYHFLQFFLSPTFCEDLKMRMHIIMLQDHIDVSNKIENDEYNMVVEMVYKMLTKTVYVESESGTMLK